MWCQIENKNKNGTVKSKRGCQIAKRKKSCRHKKGCQTEKTKLNKKIKGSAHHWKTQKPRCLPSFMQVLVTAICVGAHRRREVVCPMLVAAGVGVVGCVLRAAGCGGSWLGAGVALLVGGLRSDSSCVGGEACTFE